MGTAADQLDDWLKDIGLGKYSDVFRENDVDFRALPFLEEEDLKELGVSLGHRRILLAEIQKLSGPGDRDETEGETTAPAAPMPPEKPGSVAEKRHLSVLFVDLVGSTELTNRLDPEEMREVLRRFQDTVAGEVTRFGGYIAKYLGDGMLIFYGWPTAYEDHAYRAARSGLGVLHRVQKIETPLGEPLAARVGIASGPVVIGDLVGANTREEAAVTGAVLNLAARIQSIAPPNAMVTTDENARSMLGNLFEVEELGEFDLKGFDHPVGVVQVLREPGAESRFRAFYGESGDSIVGREHELGILRQTWERVRSGIGETMILVGEAGIGKSRLLEEFLGRCVDMDATDVIRLNCSPYFSRSAFHPVTERIAQDAGLQPEDNEKAVVEKVRALLAGRRNFDVEGSLPVYAALVAPGSPAAAAVTSLAPQEQRDLTVQVLVDALWTRASVKPVLLVVEDAHWLDPSTKQLLDRFVATCSDIPLMVLVSHRPEWNSGWAESFSNISTVNLRRFDKEQVAKLILQMTGKEPGASLLENILDRTDGVPLFVEEVTRVIFGSGSGEALSSVPSSLQGALMARLDAVSESAKRTALTASVIGREFDPVLLRAAAERTSAETMESLEELRRHGLVFESGVHRGLYVFRHALIRDTAYQSMLSTTRRAQHAAVASALMTLRPKEVERSPELIARHLTEAGDYAAAFDRWCEATERSLARSASAEAVSHAEETLRVAKELGDGITKEMIAAQILLGRSYEGIGRLQEAQRTLYHSAQEARLLTDFELFANAAYNYSEASLMANDNIEISSALCREAMQYLSPEEEFLRCRILSQLSRCTILEGKFAESADFSRQAIALAGKLGDDKAKFAVMMSRFMAPLIAKEPDEVREWRSRLDEMQGVAQRLGDTDRGRERTINLFISAEMGDREQVERSLDELLVIGKDRKHPQLHWVERHGRAMLAILDGDFKKAEALSKDAFAIGKTTHGPQVEGVYSVQMFTIRREQARLHEVAPVIKKLLDDNPDDQAWKPGFALIAAELGYLDAAQRILTEMSDSGFDLPLDAMYSTTLAYLAEVAAAVGDKRVSETIYSLLVPYRDCTITAGVTTVCNGAAGRRLGSLAALLGDWNLAETHFERALELDRGMRAKPWIAHGYADHARALRSRGRPEDAAKADRLERDALEIARELGMIALASMIEGTRH